MAESADCRILVISPNAEQARHFIQRVQGLSGSSTQTVPSPSERTDNVFPWTIVNRYYTADVHFQIRAFSEFRIPHADGVPAVVYVWERGQSYRDHIEDIASRLRDHDPEVSLAVRFSGDAPSSVSEEDGLDEFLSSHGFEYIEGDREPRRPTHDEDKHTADDDTGIPGLSRVLDALSTIMWPSLVQSESTRTRKSRARELLDWARDEEGDDGLRALIPGSASAGDISFSSDADVDGPEPRKSRMQREMEELERWLADEDRERQAADAQAWIAVERDVPLQSSAWQDMPTPSIRTPTAETLTLGFDDDFTEFVSAPSPAVSARSHHSGLDVDHLIPQHTGASYRSLASVSDFGGEGEHMFVPDIDESAISKPTEDDPDLPSRAEVLATSRRIFGTERPAPSPPTSAPPMSSHVTDESHSSDHDDDDDFGMSAFDLPRVLSALQGMKEEIAGMTDDAERRKAAARVALGLVYGLQLDGADD
ncbi:uncharacterized protein B0H18DRAFT_974812 [Fomitopsis serialis]|uniref:uncharacterized protein n=1 Tax=Fomitopsis serialis TaxID=139415 RepID=UPI0020079A7A|nr:uncharacterized protein B0H18DRAFT_974812 [Neoantrodia serialis]KAH9936641.1 hypothetical protein B0H18DRAFT_974812 [Neoantrodia serialis]